MNLYIPTEMRDLEEYNWIAICDWCDDYQKHGQAPVDGLTRFAIGIYQIYQGIEWKDQDNRDESWAAAALHFIMAGTYHGIWVDESVFNAQFSTIWYQEILLHISKTQQQIVYGWRGNKTQRASSRFNRARLQQDLTQLCKLIISTIPDNRRESAFRQAISIMAKTKL